jgi:purine-binding chemotaxis protein CheW
MRREFDAAFAAPAKPAQGELHRVLAIRVGRERLAVRLDELDGLQATRKIVALPASARGLLGIIGIRGRLLSVYHLASLIGAGPGDGPSRWLLVARGAEPVAFAFEELEAHLVISASELRPTRGGEGESEHIAGVLERDGVVRGVIDISLVMATVARLSRDGRRGP